MAKDTSFEYKVKLASLYFMLSVFICSAVILMTIYLIQFFAQYLPNTRISSFLMYLIMPMYILVFSIYYIISRIKRMEKR